MNVVQEVHPSTSVNSSITLQGGRGARRPRPGEDYTPSPEIVEWVKARGHGAYLELHVEKFRNACATQRRKAYDDIDSAFRNCVLDDWGRVRFQAQMAARRGDGPAAPTQAKKWPKCRYCPRESSATHDGIPHCGADACSSRALDREPAPA